MLDVNKLSGGIFFEMKKDAIDTLQYLFRKHRDKSIEFVLAVFHNWFAEIHVSDIDAKYIKSVTDAGELIKPLDMSNDFIEKSMKFKHPNQAKNLIRVR